MGDDFDWTQLLNSDEQLSWNDFLPEVEGVSWNDFLPEVQEVTWNDFLPDASGKPAFEEDYRKWLYGKEGYGEGMTGQQTARYDYVLEKTGSKTLADLAATKGFDTLTNAFQAAKNVFGSPAGMASIGALLGAADRQRPSGGGTTMAYQGPAELKRKIVQGPYGPVAEYEGVGGGSPDYTRFAAPTITSPAPAPSAPAGQTAQQKADLYKFMRDSLGMSDAQIRQFANYSYGDQKDSDWQELLRLVGGNAPATSGAKGQTQTAGSVNNQNDSFVNDLQNAMGQSSATQVPSHATVDPKSSTFRQYNLSQEASDFLNRQNAATGNPWEYDSKTRKYTRQGSSGLEIMSSDDVQKRALQERVQSDIALSESRRPQRDPQEQANLDAYVKQALPNLLEDASRTGGYTPITNFLVKYGITEADINRAFGPGGPSPDFNARVQSGDIDVPIIGYGGGSLAYDRSLGTTSGPSAPLTKFSVPDYVTQAYGLLGKTEQKTEGQVPSWLQYYRSPAVGPEDMDRARQTAAEFGKVYGREITPDELDDFMGGARANIVQNLGLDTKNRADYISAIAPAKEETLKRILRQAETGGGHLTQADMVSLGFGNYDSLTLTPQEAVEALSSGNTDQYIQQRARKLGMQSVVPPKTELFGEVAGLKLTAPQRDLTWKSLGGMSIADLPSLIQRFGLNDEELGQLEQLMRSSGDEQYATKINQLRTGTLPPQSWGHAAWQNQNTADFFKVTGTPEAENFIYQGAFTPLINEVSGLNKIGYQPGMGIAAGPPKPTEQQAAATAVGTPYAAAPAAQPPAQPAAPRDLMSLLPSEWGTYTGAEGAQKKIDWFNQQKATEAELRAAGVKPEEIAWMRQNKLGTYAQGGPVRMEDGGFVMTKRAVDGAGGPRGIQQLVPGARMIKGPGHGTSDSIPAYIQGRNGRTPARLSNGEAYVPPGRDTDKLYALMKSLERNA